MKLRKLLWFKRQEWKELERYNQAGELLHTVTCTGDNYRNLYESQFSTRKYGEVFRYKIHNP